MKKMSVLLSLVFILGVGGFFLHVGTKVTGQADKGWKVWVKTSPCSGRHDWVTVAQENPAFGGGGGAWANADLILFGTGMHCVRNIDQCSFAAATAEAAMVRASSKFSDYCCREYSVWENNQTGKKSIVVGKFGTAGYGWRFLDGPMCCEEAEALAGIPGACSGTSDSRGGAGWQPTNEQASLQGETLTYYRGTTAEKCQIDCGANPRCKGFTFIRQGAYNPNDAPMCYLISKVTAAATSSCCISAIKEGVTGQIEGGGIMARKRVDKPEVEEMPEEVVRPNEPRTEERQAQGVDLSGTWVADDKEHHYVMVLKRASLPNEWEGTWKITSKVVPGESPADTYRVRVEVDGRGGGHLYLPFYIGDVTSYNANQIVADRTYTR